MDNQRNKFTVLLQIYQADRDELLKRVEQRDKYVIQYIVTVGAILGANGVIFDSESVIGPLAIMTVPFISLYFKCQMMNSYHVHGVLVKHIMEIEQEIKNYLELDPSGEKLFWQTYISKELYEEKKDCSSSEQNDSARKRILVRIFHVVSLGCVLLAGVLFIIAGSHYENLEGMQMRDRIGWAAIGGIIVFVVYIFLDLFLFPEKTESSEGITENCKCDREDEAKWDTQKRY